MKKAVITTENEWALETLGDSPMFTKKNPSEVAKAVTHLLKAPTRRLEIASRAWLKVASTQNWKIIASRHNKLYHEIARV